MWNSPGPPSAGSKGKAQEGRGGGDHLCWPPPDCGQRREGDCSHQQTFEESNRTTCSKSL